MVSTLSCKGDEVGFPRGSVIEHVIDEQGRPIFSLSALSAHNADLRQDGRCSFTVMQPGFRVALLLLNWFNSCNPRQSWSPCILTGICCCTGACLQAVDMHT